MWHGKRRSHVFAVSNLSKEKKRNNEEKTIKMNNDVFIYRKEPIKLYSFPREISRKVVNSLVVICCLSAAICMKVSISQYFNKRILLFISYFYSVHS